MNSKGVFAVITAAGSGSRLKGAVKKQFRDISGRPVLARTLEVFNGLENIAGIILTVPPGTGDYCRKEIVAKYGFNKKTSVITGGRERQDSVYRALKKIPQACSIVVIHDGVRPFVTKKMINESIRQAALHGASMVGVPLNDTIKKVSARNFVIDTPSRENIWRIQTPQAFKYRVIMEAHRKYKNSNATDDAGLVEKLGIAVKLVRGSSGNIKITTPEDLAMAEAIAGGGSGRYGIGYDIHTLVPGRKLYLGGIRIPFKKGLLGHSDGDSLLHSICDALLGAMGERDIGVHFPNTDKRYKGISSLILLEEVMEMLYEKGYRARNLDAMIIAREPKITPYANRMKKVIAGAMDLDSDSISVKATTNEGVGLIGDGGAIAAYSIVSIVK